MPWLTKEDQRLSLVSRLHMILGWIGIVWVMTLGSVTMFGRGRIDEPPDVTLVLNLITGIGLVGSLLLASCLVAVASFVRHKRNHAFCIVISALLCLCFPFGTIVGVYSVYILNNEKIKKMFEKCVDVSG